MRQTWPNKPTAPNPARALRFQSWHHWRGSVSRSVRRLHIHVDPCHSKAIQTTTMPNLKPGLVAVVAIAVLPIAHEARAFLDHWNSGVGGNSSHNGLTWERGPTNANVLWQGGLESDIGYQAVAEGNIVVMTRVIVVGSEGFSTIVAQDLTTGAILWTNDLPRDFPQTDRSSWVKGIRDGRVYATRSDDGASAYLYALDITNGSVLWRSEEIVRTARTESVVFAPNGDLIVGNLYSLMRVNATNGTRMWNTNRRSPSLNCAEPAIFSSRMYAWEQSGLGPIIHVYDLATGTFLYASPGGIGLIQQIGLFVGPDGTVYAPRAQDNVITDYLIAFHDTGSSLVEKWRVPLGFVPFASFGIGPDGTVYSYSQDYRVIRLDPQSGKILNASPVLSSTCWHPRMAIDSSGIVFLTTGGCNPGDLVSLNADLSVRWTEPMRTRVNLGGPVIGRNGTLLVCGGGTDVRAYRGTSNGLPGPPLQLSRQGPSIVITFSGRLQSIAEWPGIWADVPGAVSPWTVPTQGAQTFYRSVLE
jgi:outer membrane protein assembly factor BamB